MQWLSARIFRILYINMVGMFVNSLKRFSSLNLNAFSATKKIPERNTYIFKRTYPALVRKENATRYRRLKAKHFEYELIEDVNETNPPNLRVVLTSFVEGVGDVGDVISVKPHYARQSLLLPRKAVYATPENIEHYAKLKKERPERPDFSSIFAGMTIRFLSKKVVPVFMSSEEPWKIEPWHIRVALRTEGIIITKEALKMLDGSIVGPDPIKEEKDFAVSVTINKTETVPVRCRLFHIQKLGITNLSEEFYLGKREAILKEQEELLNNLPMPELEDNRPEANISLKEKHEIKILN